MNLIPKKQTGGSFASMFATYMPLQTPQSSGGRASSRISSVSSSKDDDNDDKKGMLTEKDLFSLLKEVDGLPNEMEYITNSIQRMYQASSILGTDGIGTSSLSSMYAQITYNIKSANFNKKEYDKAYKQAEKNQGINELAITESGKVVVKDEKDEMKQVPVSDFLKNQDKYIPLTNSNLLQMRAWDKRFVNNNMILDIVSNGIGMEKVHSMIKERFSKLGSSDQSYSGNISISDRKALAGAHLLQQLSEEEQSNLGIDGMYKAKIITKDQKQQAEQALKYIYSSLPSNAQALLAIRSGDAENPTKGATEIIWSLITSQMNPSKEVDIEYESVINSDGSKRDSSGKGNSLDDEEINIAQQFLRGYGQKESFVINPGTNVATSVTSNALPLVKKDGTPLGAGCTLQEISQGQFGPILDWNNVTMGGRKINPLYLNQIIVSDGTLRSIDFPVDENGNPDLRPTTLQAKKEADRLIAEAGINMDDPNSVAEHADQINQILQSVGLGAAYDSNGNIVSGNWRRFGVMNGTADNRTLGVDPLGNSSQLLHEITDDAQIDALISTIQEKTEQDKLQFDKNDWRIFEGDYDMFLEGTIWIPLNVNDWNAAAGSGQTISRKLGLEMENRQQETDRRNELLRSYKNPGQP